MLRLCSPVKKMREFSLCKAHILSLVVIHLLIVIDISRRVISKGKLRIFNFILSSFCLTGSSGWKWWEKSKRDRAQIRASTKICRFFPHVCVTCLFDKDLSCSIIYKVILKKLYYAQHFDADEVPLQATSYLTSSRPRPLFCPVTPATCYRICKILLRCHSLWRQQ